LSAPFLSRHVTLVESTNTGSTNWAIRASLGHYFEEDHELSSGQRLPLNFQLMPGKPAMEIGIQYYVDGADLTNRHETWCPQVVCYQPGKSKTQSREPERPAGDKK